MIFLFPVFAFAFFLFLKFKIPETYLNLIQEDALIEYGQSLFYFLAAIPSFLLSVKFLKNRLPLHGILYGLLTLGLLFVAMEEISWGQRILNIETTPWFMEHNLQGETTLHNLDNIQPGLHALFIALGAFGTFGWFFMKLLLLKVNLRQRNILNFIIPDWQISPCFLSVLFIYGLYEYLGKEPAWDFILKGDQEPPELLLSFGFLIFAVTNYRKFAEICKGSDTSSIAISEEAEKAA